MYIDSLASGGRRGGQVRTFAKFPPGLVVRACGAGKPYVASDGAGG